MIRISGLSFKYDGGREEALKNIDMTVCRGDFLGVIGSSGAGKTTLLHAINGIIPHHFRGDFYGSVEVNGSDTVDNKPEQLAGTVGSVRQDFESQMVSSVVEDEILFGLENFSVPRDEIEKRMTDALDKTGIRNLRETRLLPLIKVHHYADNREQALDLGRACAGRLGMSITEIVEHTFRGHGVSASDAVDAEEHVICYDCRLPIPAGQKLCTCRLLVEAE